ncbi:hypothetical protein AK812_SmicGene46989 [Symbiodinium microadriaticum]|uniref:Uncharacterized protein n=1 Tax=Symbiodinium microadriaticum TaxID=2951 RepID=A0A1Q9BSW4_SYMMI|nr:hypothetical protein AK812_SmicGene46989 [Symbiodinium microadriaticum]
MAGVASSSNQTFQSAATSDRRKSSPKFRSFHPICPSMASHEAAAQSENTCDKSQSWPLARAQIIDWKSGRSVLAGQEHLPLRNALPSVCLDHWQQGWPHVQLQDAPGSGCFICDRSAPSTQTMAEKSSTFPVLLGQGATFASKGAYRVVPQQDGNMVEGLGRACAQLTAAAASAARVEEQLDMMD